MRKNRIRLFRSNLTEISWRNLNLIFFDLFFEKINPCHDKINADHRMPILDIKKFPQTLLAHLSPLVYTYMVTVKKVVIYETTDGDCPVSSWLESLDRVIRVRIKKE